MRYLFTYICFCSHSDSEEVFKRACGSRVHVKIQSFIVRVKVDHDTPNGTASVVDCIATKIGESSLQRTIPNFLQQEQLPTLTLMLLEEKNGMGGSWPASGSMTACPAAPTPIGWVAGA